MKPVRAREPGSLLVHDLTMRVTEAQDALSAIRSGEVDALVVAIDGGQQVYILEGADQAHRILLETLNEGAATIAGDATILYANRTLAEVLGRPLAKVLGAALTRFIAPEHAARFAALLAEAARGHSKGELALVRTGGARVPVMLSMSAMGDATSLSYTVVVTDLTSLQEAQTALRRANDELEAKVLARTAELSATNARLLAEIAERTRLEEELRGKAAELVEADRRKDEFLSMLGHELRNPLAPILAASEMIRAMTGIGSDRPALERYSGVISRQVKNLTRIVDDLLDVARITRGAITLRKQPIELTAVVRSAVNAVRPLLDASRHELTVTLPSEPVELHADPTRLEQVIVNLLNNAAKYTERGGRIALSAQQQGAEVILRVGDNGVGIAADLLPRVFDLFVQSARTLDRAQGGLGIGLTLVKNLVEMHGGSIEAHSPGPGKGSEFVLRLPRTLDSFASATPTADEAAPSSGGASRRVLVVEDNADAAQTLAELVALWGHRVVRASDGEGALRLAATFRPHVVLMDIGLPGMDGYEVARRLQSDHGAAEEPGDGGPLLIGLTGYGQDSDRSRAEEAGFDHFLVKPPDPTVLRRVLMEGGPAGGNAPERGAGATGAT